VTLAVQVQKGNGEEVRRILDRSGAVDRRVKIVESDGSVQIPLLRVLDEAESSIIRSLGGEVIEMTHPSQRAARETPFDSIRAALDIPVEAKALLPQKWELLGDVLVIKLYPALERWKAEIAEAYAAELGARTVLREIAPVTGQFREPQVEKLMGGGTETVHVENGIKYKLDAARLMFSSGNMDERLRMASISKPGETVVDMFAGIGYFTLPLAKYSKPDLVIAHEINPLSHAYLVENVRLNGLWGTVEPRLGDCMAADEGVADRVLMGYVGTTHLYLRKAIRILRGPGTIHYHETCPEALLAERPRQRVADAVEAEGAKARVLLQREVKSYAPGVTHVVLDVFVNP
jgi:tRNA wybutosine-synthesizing protein 2